MSQLAKLKSSDLTRYLAPFIVFMLMTEAQNFFEGKQLFYVYSLKTFLTGALILWLFKGKFKSEVLGKLNLESIGLGVLAFLVWILLTSFYEPTEPARFNPNVFENLASCYFFTAMRIIGAVFVVAFMEEVLWRSCLMRWLIKEDFLSVELGAYELKSFWITVAAFTLVHVSWEWPAAFAVGILYGGFVVRRKNLVGVIVAHGVTNLLLAGYVIYTGKFYYW